MSNVLKDAVKQVAPQAVPAEQITVVKASGRREAFEPEKLLASLLHSGASQEASEEVLERITSELHNDITTDEIYRHAFEYLKEVEKPSARKYSLRRAVMELGPSGFPFEKFFAEILKAKGYDTATGEMVLGGCVTHEVDVVAWNEKKLIMVEAKFHNELGTKSDLKVALYVKARFDDIQDNVYDYGGRNREVTDCWLVTNTKFSSTAIHYGECMGMTLIGWNYPKKGNLEDLIVAEGLHPITCLTSLTPEQKRVLVESHMVLCSQVEKEPGVLVSLFGHKFNTQAVMSEIAEL